MLEHSRSPRRVIEARHEGLNGLLPYVPKWGMTAIVTQGDGARQRSIQRQALRYIMRKICNFDRMVKTVAPR